MPVLRVPVVHKFGIVSVSRAEQLLREGRRDQRSNGCSRRVKTTILTKISQSFIKKYNETPESERGRLDSIVHRTFSQAKYKAGLHRPQSGAVFPLSTGSTSHQPPPPGLLSSGVREGDEMRVCDAWVEFILLCQCYGSHQEDVLLALATSLNHAPPSTLHIPSLLYMCGLCYQWLKSDLSVSQSGQLRSGELILLRILYLISLRLFYHHMMGALQDICTREEIRQLKFDLDGFESRERVYRNFPEALLHWKVSLEVGQVVVEKNRSAALHEPSDPNIPEPSPAMPSTSCDTSTHGGGGGGGGEGRHAMSPVLWHSLDIWRVIRGIAHGQVEDAIADLLACSTEFNVENWMESLFAINILCLGSQLSLPVISLLHSLADGTTPLFPHSESSAHHHLQNTLQTHLSPSLGSIPHSASLFRDTPTITSRTSEDTGKTNAEKPPFNSLPPKKGTRFKLPGLEVDGVLYSDDQTSSDIVASSRRRAQMDTLNVLGVQPGFREPYPESVHAEAQSCREFMDEDYHTHLYGSVPTNFNDQQGKAATTSRHKGELESIATQSLVDSESVPRTMDSGRSSAHCQTVGGLGELGSESTLGKLSPSQSLVITSSPWLKSSTSKNLELSNSDHREEGSQEVQRTTLQEPNELHSVMASEDDEKSSGDIGSLQGTWRSDIVHGTSTEEQLKDLESPLGESLDQTGNYMHLQDLLPQQTDISGRSVTLGRHVETRCTHYTHSSPALSDGAGVPGSHVAPSTVYRHSIYTPLTIDVESEENGGCLSSGLITAPRAKLESWPSEVALAYTLSMCDVVIYGRTSPIQSAALEGEQGGGRRVGLTQLAEFSLPDHSTADFEAWAIRHCAVLGLSRVCHIYKQRIAKDGLSSVAWSALMERHSTEKDRRVLEAYKMSQDCQDMDGPLLALDTDTLSSPLLACMADELAKVFLPPVNNTISSKSPPKRLRPLLMRSNHLQQATAKVKTHHKQSKLHRVDFAARTLAAINDIMEHDWQREMQKERDQEAMGESITH